MRILIATACIALAASSCSSSPVKTQKDNEVKISNYRTYQWLTQKDAMDLNLENPPTKYLTGWIQVKRRPEAEDQVRGLIERNLREKGYVPVSKSPDFFVTFYGKAKDSNWLSSWSGNTLSLNEVPLVIFPNFNYDRTKAFTDTWNFKQNQVFLVIYDAQTHRPAWSGSVDSSSFDRDLKGPPVEIAIGEMVSDFKESA